MHSQLIDLRTTIPGASRIRWATVVAALGCSVAPVCAAAQPPTLHVFRNYNQAAGVIEWEISVTEGVVDGASISVELPFELSAVDPANGFTPLLSDAADNTNGLVNDTWYYNETAAGSGVLIMNTAGNPADETQNPGFNPYAGAVTEGLWVDAPSLKLFAALGSDANLPTPIPVLHIATSDGKLSWLSAKVVESAVGHIFSGSLSSLRLADMNADDAYNRADVRVMSNALANFLGYQATYPGLDGVARGDVVADSALTNADLELVAVDFEENLTINGGDLTAWESAFGSNGLPYSRADANGDGQSDGNDLLLLQRKFGSSAPSTASANVVPEPNTALLVVVGALLAIVLWFSMARPWGVHVVIGAPRRNRANSKR